MQRRHLCVHRLKLGRTAITLPAIAGLTQGYMLRCRDELGIALQRTPPHPAFFEALREELSASSGDSTATTDGLRLDEAGVRALVCHPPHGQMIVSVICWRS